jgi:hypothetical protein
MTDRQMARSASRQRPASRPPKPGGLLRTAILSALGVLLAWEVILRSAAAYLADDAPDQALLLDARQPAALINVADEMLADSGDAGPSDAGSPEEARRRDRIRAAAEQALVNAPINARGAWILGQLADDAKDGAHAAQFMEAAVRFSLRESEAAYWMMRQKAQDGRYRDALYYADVILRTRPEMAESVVPGLAAMAEDARTSGEIKALLAGNPPWRRQFFMLLPASITDARTPLSLLLPLRTTAAPPASIEIVPYLSFLVAHKFYDLAYYAWLQFLPPGQLDHAGLLFNGSFETPPWGGPFDWTIMQGAGVTIDIVPRPDDGKQHALLVEFQHGRVEFNSVTQLVVMAPGAYRFTGRYKGELAGPSGLKWRVTCAAGTAAQAGEGPMITGAAPAWTDFAFAFSVPEAGCGAQQVRLDLEARTASERLVTGQILFDELEIRRSAGPPT